MPSSRVPLLGLAAAFVFAAQMVNFPVAGGTSGHMMGAVLTSILLGPSSAIVVVMSVLVVQCLLFADGGLLALGANVFNMAIIGSLAGYWLFRLVSRLIPGETGRMVGVIFASWCSVVLASMCCAGELAWSNTVAAETAFPAMIGVHALIGLGEGVVTVLVVTAIRKARPDLLRTEADERSSHSYRDIIVSGSLVVVGLVVFVMPFASPWPDGLEKVAAALGFDQRALQNPTLPALMPDYRFPGIGSASIATVVSGVIGVLVVFLLSLVLATMLRRKSKSQPSPDPSSRH
jgi:cobalt/nickel transport system permease protein